MVEKHIKHLLRDNNKVTVPGLGTFVTKLNRASFSEDSKSISPPECGVTFEEFSSFYNDVLLCDSIAKHLSISEDEAQKKISDFADEIKSQVEVFDKSTIKGLGTLRKTPNGDVILEQEEGIYLLGESYGLPKVNITPIKSIIGGAAAKDLFDENPVAKDTNRYMVLVIVVPALIIFSFLGYIFFNETAKEKVFGLFDGNEEVELVESTEKDRPSPFEDTKTDSSGTTATEGASAQNEAKTPETEKDNNAAENKAAEEKAKEDLAKENKAKEEQAKKEQKEADKAAAEKAKADKPKNNAAAGGVNFIDQPMGRYHLVVATLSTKDNALRGAKQYAAKGLSPIVFDDNGKFRISVDNASSEENARAKKAEISNDHPGGVLVVKY